jgi:hypothetical protein
MSVKSGFFNSVNGDRTYNADDINEFFDGVYSDGVFKGYDATLEVTPGEGMSISVAGGKALALGKYIRNNGALNLSISGSGTLPRYDAVVAGVELEERAGDIYIKEGTPASSPAYPEILDTATKKELCLAYIYVAAGATTITESNITDTRADESVCGYVQLTNVSAVPKIYRNSVEITTAGTSNVSIGIPEFDAGNDELFVYLDGGLLIEAEDYTITGTGSTASINLINSIQYTNDNWFNFIVLKGEI